METTTSPEVTELADEELTTASLGGRLKSSLSLVQTRITGVPALARAQWTGIPSQLDLLTDRIATRVRETLDLPSKSDLDELLSRVDELDKALATLINAKQKKAPAKKAAAKKQPAKKQAAKSKAKAKSEVATKAKRKAKIKQAAGKSSRK